MKSINDRIEEIANHYFKGNKRAFAKHIGIPETSISNYIGKKRKSKPSAEMLEKIVNILGVNSEWLLTGKGSMLKEAMINESYNDCVVSGDNSNNFKRNNNHVTIGNVSQNINISVPKEGNVKIIMPDGSVETYSFDLIQNLDKIEQLKTRVTYLENLLASKDKIISLLEK